MSENETEVANKTVAKRIVKPTPTTRKKRHYAEEFKELRDRVKTALGLMAKAFHAENDETKRTLYQMAYETLTYQEWDTTDPRR